MSNHASRAWLADPSRVGAGPPPRRAPLGPLTRAILETVFDAFEARTRASRWALTALFWLSARLLARRGRAFEEAVTPESGLRRASWELMRRHAGSVAFEGADRIPETGPLLIVCNHAGMGDALGVLSATPRADVAVLALRRGLLTALPIVARSCIEIDPDHASASLRRAVRHLRAGRALLMFPAGRIEVDPRVDAAAALGSLDGWSRSVTLLAAATPGLRVLPVGVGGLVSERALGLPILRRQRPATDRAFAAATLQLLLPGFRDTRVAVMFGEPLGGEEATPEAIRTQMRRLLTRAAERVPPEGARADAA